MRVSPLCMVWVSQVVGVVVLLEGMISWVWIFGIGRGVGGSDLFSLCSVDSGNGVRMESLL